MAILYAPSGEPRLIPDGEVSAFLRLGYRPVPFPTRPTPLPTSAPGADLTDPAPPSGLDINTASMKEIAALPNVGAAIARRVINQRPYTTLEDLAAKVEGTDWIRLKSQLYFSCP